MRFHGATARPVFRVLAGVLAGIVLTISVWIGWGLVTGQVVLRDLAQALVFLAFGLPAGTAMALVAVTGKAPRWFLRQFGEGGETPPGPRSGKVDHGPAGGENRPFP